MLKTDYHSLLLNAVSALSFGRFAAACFTTFFIAATGCTLPVEFPVAPNVLRDGSGSAILAQLPQDQHFVEMPVIYVTDRASAPGTSREPNYGIERSRTVSYGIATVSLDPLPTWDELVRASGVAPVGNPYRLTLFSVDEQGTFPFSPASMELYEGNLRFRPDTAAMFASEAQKTLDLVRSRLAVTPHKDVYLYVHGVENTFEDAVGRAGAMWHYLGRQGAIVAYAWPAGRGGARGYLYDRESGEYTVYHLKRLITAISSCPEVERLHIVAHSRGCDVATTALRELNIHFQARGLSTQKELKLETLVLAAADLDVDVFSLRMTMENMAVVAKRFVVYSSKVDELVRAADWLFNSTARLGTLSQSQLPKSSQDLLATVPNLQLVQCVVSGFGTSHNYVFYNPAALSDLILVLRDRRNPGAANGRPLTPLGGAFWSLDNGYALPPAVPRTH